MSRSLTTVIGVLIVAGIAAGAGYWLGRDSSPPSSREIRPTGQTAVKAERRILFYRNPMGLPDTSPTPKKDSMGMDYIPVFEGDGSQDAGAPGQVDISADKIQKLGVRTEVVGKRVLDRAVRAAGRIEPDERKIYTIAPRFEGYVERLIVNATGQEVRKGQTLFETYSPDLVLAQQEYLIAGLGVKSLADADPEARQGMQRLASSSLERLRNWDISDDQIKALSRTGKTRRTLDFVSPVEGVVTEKRAVQGMRFMPGEMLFQIADLSTVWLIADIFEQDIGRVSVGAHARITLNAYPDKTFDGDVIYVYPTMKSETRTVSARVELKNPGFMLMPGMYAQVELSRVARGEVLSIPNSAILDSGRRQIVFVERGNGKFEPREARLGERGEQYAEVVDGLKEGERVVTSANFLIDAESNLRAAISGFAPAAPAEQGKGTQVGQARTGTVAHSATGSVDALDLQAGVATISHGPVASLKWPAMTMDFRLANNALATGILPGQQISFEFVERAPGEWVITSLSRATEPRSAGKHAGH